MAIPIEQQGAVVNSDPLQRALLGLANGTTQSSLNYLLTYSGVDEAIQPLVNSPTADNSAVLSGFLGESGSLLAAGDVRARIKFAGAYGVGALVDVDPQISMLCDARGGVVLVPSGNLPSIVPGTPGTGQRTGGGAPAALFRLVRRAPNINKQAYEPRFGGFNIDATGVAFSGTPSCYRIPNPNPNNNTNDPDQNFLTNKNYTGGVFENQDIVGFPGDQLVNEAGNGRTTYMSFRAINGKASGIVDKGNDIVCFGHWAAGGNQGGFGFQAGLGAGFFGVTGNLWGASALRQLTVGAFWFNGRKLFSLMCSEFNDWLRMDGGGLTDSSNGFWRGGNIIGCVFAQFDSNFSSDGIELDFTPGGPDSRLQCNVGITQYQSLNFVGCTHTRTPSVTFATPFNPGGDLTGVFGTAPTFLYDNGQNAYVNFIDQVCTAPNVRPYLGPQAAFTVTIASPAVVTDTAHGMLNGNRIVLTTTGALPTGLAVSTVYYVVNKTVNTYNLATTYGGAAINTSGAQSGTHTRCNFSAGPYNTHGGAQTNYIVMDAWQNSIRLGAQGNSVHSHIAIGLNESADFNPNYNIEIGDISSSISSRNVVYGLTEFDNAVMYTDGAYRSSNFNSNIVITVTPGLLLQKFFVSGGPIATGSVTLPTDMNASQSFTIYGTGGTVTSWTWGVSGSGTINPNTNPLPTTTTGFFVIEFFYSHDVNRWDVKSVFGQGGFYGRTDNVAAPVGVVGEQINAKVSSGSAVSVNSATNTNVTSIVLTAGDWLVNGNLVYTSTSATTTPTLTRGGISTIDGTTITTTDATAYSTHVLTIGVQASGTDFDSIALGPMRITVAAGTTQQVWLNARINYTGAAATATSFGTIRAIRTI